MIIIKTVILFMILIISFFIGDLISGKYINRVKELKELKKALNIFKTKIKFTYEPLPEIFLEISQNMNSNIGKIFENSSAYMEYLSADKSWIKAIEESTTSLKLEDKEVIKNLGKLLGKTDIEGQLNEIEITEIFLDTQIEEAQKEQSKNVKLYKTLGLVAGLLISIILI